MDPRPLHEPVCEGEGEGEANRSTTLPPSQEEEPPPRWNACDMGLGLGRITAFPVFPRTKQTARINRFTGRQQPPRMMQPTRQEAGGVEEEGGAGGGGGANPVGGQVFISHALRAFSVRQYWILRHYTYGSLASTSTTTTTSSYMYMYL